MRRKVIALFAPLLFSLLCSAKPKRDVGNFEVWLGVYLKDQKVGFSFTALQKYPDYYRVKNRMRMKLGVMGTTQELTSTLEGKMHTDLSLDNFYFDLVSRNHKFRVYGKHEGSKIHLKVETAGRTTEQDIEVGEKVYLPVTLGVLIAKEKAKPGKKYSFNIFDPTILSPATSEVVIEGEEDLKVGDHTYRAVKIRSTLLGMTSTTWLDSIGATLKEVSPPGLVMLRQSPEQVLSEESTQVYLDIISLFSVKPDKKIDNPRESRYLKLQLFDIDTTLLDLEDISQHILALNPLTIEIKPPEIKPTPLALPIKGEEKFLKSSLYIQSDDPEIKGKAKEIIGGTKNGQEAAKRILDWVYRNIEKRATASVPSAVEVLKTKEGDCNEHSILYAALCRAVGIPTKVVVGLVYLNDAFYYHAWNKVYLGEWIPVDPTFGGFPADAAHIKLKEGELEEQAKVLKVVGNLKIKIVEYY